jgi:hypothetical protein
MLRKFTVSVVLASCVALLATISPAGAADAILRATLTGAAERPGPGDPDASGSAWIFIDDESNQLCLFMTWRNVDPTLSGLHIHVAPPTDPGPIVVPFDTPPPAVSGSTFQCVTVADEALLDNIAANPQQYYINLHSTPNFRPGAIRGQLQHA